MQVTLHLMANSQVSQDPICLPHKTDQLFLDFQVDGCFCTAMEKDFNPHLPNGFCTKKTHPGPYNPLQGNHDTQYQWDTTENCDCKHSNLFAMHTIQTGN